MKLLLITTIFFSGSLAANEFSNTLCKFGEQERKIEIVYSQGTPVPCEVHYTKPSGTQILWKAEGEVGYCESKASALVEKQQGWGWACEAVEESMTEEVQEEVAENSPEMTEENIEEPTTLEAEPSID